MNDKNLRIREIANDVRFVADVLMLAARIAEMPGCNDCGVEECEYEPRWGEPIRYNCPLWKERKNETD